MHAPPDAPSPFVTVHNGQLYLAGRPFAFASLNAPELLDPNVNGPFEWRDTMATLATPGGFALPVTRSYTLRINSKNIGNGHIKRWNAGWGTWEFDGDRMKEMDGMLDEAGRHGVKLIVPLINQDFGSEEMNWVGNTTDMIRYRKGLSYEGARAVDFWTDHEMIESTKLLIDFVLDRVNTINGVRYGDDPTILAWETGNELNFLGYRGAPASWTLTIARHIKSRSRQLVMDGSFARCDSRESCFPDAVMGSPDVDLMSYHYYGSGEISRLKADVEYVRKRGKVLIIGEYGFFEREQDYDKFLKVAKEVKAQGTLVWSLRPHSAKGGFNTHSEGNGIFSYHVPGCSPSPHARFDGRDGHIIAAIRSASYELLGLKVPPTPDLESIGIKPVLHVHAGAPARVWWTGVPWAASYELLTASGARQVWDLVGEGELAVGLYPQELGKPLSIRAIGPQGQRGLVSDPIQVDPRSLAVQGH